MRTFIFPCQKYNHCCYMIFTKLSFLPSNFADFAMKTVVSGQEISGFFVTWKLQIVMISYRSIKFQSWRLETLFYNSSNIFTTKCKLFWLKPFEWVHRFRFDFLDCRLSHRRRGRPRNCCCYNKWTFCTGNNLRKGFLFCQNKEKRHFASLSFLYYRFFEEVFKNKRSDQKRLLTKKA